MPAAARVLDVTNHGGCIMGPGEPSVLIGGMPASVLGDNHVCVLPPIIHQPTASPIIAGSSSVLIGGKPAARVGDACGCGASAAVGMPSVMIG